MGRAVMKAASENLVPVTFEWRQVPDHRRDGRTGNVTPKGVRVCTVTERQRGKGGRPQAIAFEEALHENDAVCGGAARRLLS